MAVVVPFFVFLSSWLVMWMVSQLVSRAFDNDDDRFLLELNRRVRW